MSYDKFIDNKKIIYQSAGIDANDISENLFDFQRDLVKWALKKGKAALFAMTGTGKTMMQLEWARQVHNHTGGKVLILAPLAVGGQTVAEGHKIGINAKLCRSHADTIDGINVANYEMLHHFNCNDFAGIVLDESSILKSFTGKIRNQIIESFERTPYKLSATATPAPNDYMELGNQAEFLGVMSRNEMLAMFFVHDSGETAKWRLKGHAQSKFWEWVASWGAVMTKPSDLGYDDERYNLPPLKMHEHCIETEHIQGHTLFAVEAQTLQERQAAKKDTTEIRCQKAAEIVNNSDKPFIVWCNLNDESALLKKLINDAVEVKGSDTPEFKEKAAYDFSHGNKRVIITKPSIFGHGLNWQHCADMVFVGLSDSFEQYFQAVRRCYRFGQDKSVNVHIVTADREGAIKANIERKEKDALAMFAEMVKYTADITTRELHHTTRETAEYNPQVKMILPEFIKEMLKNECA